MHIDISEIIQSLLIKIIDISEFQDPEMEYWYNNRFESIIIRKTFEIYKVSTKIFYHK